MASNKDYADGSRAKNTKDSDKVAYSDALIAGWEALQTSERMARLDAWISEQQQEFPWLAKIDEASRNQLVGYADTDEVRQWLSAFAEKARSADGERVSDLEAKQNAGGEVDSKQLKKPRAKKDAAGSKKSQRTAEKSSEQNAGGEVDSKQPKKPRAKKDAAGSKKSQPGAEKLLEKKRVSQSEVQKTASDNQKNAPMGDEALPGEQDGTPISVTNDAGDAVGVESSEASKAVVAESGNEKLVDPVEEIPPKEIPAEEKLAEENPDTSSQVVVERGVIESESSEAEDAEQASDAASADGQGGEQQPVRFDHTKWQRALFWMSASDFDALIKDLWSLAQNMDDQAIEAFYKNNHAVLDGVGDDEMSLFVQFALNFNDQEAFKRDAYDRFGAYLLRPVSDEETSWCKKQWATLRLDVADLPEKAEHVQASTLSVRRLESGGGCVSFSMHWSRDGGPSDQDPHNNHASSWSKASMDKAYLAACWLHDQGYKQAVIASDHRQLARNMWAIATINNLEVDGFDPQHKDNQWLARARESLEQKYSVSFEHTPNAAPGLGKGGTGHENVSADDQAAD